MADEPFLDAEGFYTPEAGPMSLPNAATGNVSAPAEVRNPFPQDGGMTAEEAIVADQRPVMLEGEDPYAFRSRDDRWLREHNLKRFGGQSQVDPHWMPQSASRGAPDDFAPMRDELAARGRGLAKDWEAIELQKAENARVFNDQQVLQAQEEVLRKEQEMAEIDAAVSRQRLELDDALQNQKNLISKGISPWAAYSGSGSAAGGRISAALTMMAAAAASPETFNQVANNINQTIAREIDAQKTEVQWAGDQASNAYTRLRDTYGDAQQAEAALRLLMADATAAELEGLVLQTADPEIMLKAQQMMLEIDNMKNAADQEFNAKAYGTITERFNPGRAGSAGGIRSMTADEANRNQASMASTAGKVADTTSQWQENLAAGDVASGDLLGAAGDAIIKEVGNTKAVNQYGKTVEGLKTLSDLSKLRGGQGLNLDSRQFEGEQQGFWADKAPGRGVFDKATNWFSKKGTEYDRKVQMAVNAYRNAISGQAGAEAELIRIQNMIDSTTELQHLAGVNALKDALFDAQEGIKAATGPRVGRVLDARMRHQLGSATGASSFNYSER